MAVFYANVAVSYKAVYFSDLTRANVPVILERNKVEEQQRDGRGPDVQPGRKTPGRVSRVTSCGMTRSMA